MHAEFAHTTFSFQLLIASLRLRISVAFTTPECSYVRVLIANTIRNLLEFIFERISSKNCT